VKIFRQLRVQAKVVTLTMLTAMTALLLAGAALFWYEQNDAQSKVGAELTSLAQVIAGNTAAALAFKDRKAATETLAGLRAEPQIVAAGIYDDEGGLVATYARAGANPKFPPAPDAYGYKRVGERITYFGAVYDSREGRRIGTIYFEADLAEMRQRLLSFAKLLVLVFGASCLIAFTFAMVIQREISGPIVRLASITQHISARRDYSVRMPRESDDEFGQLAAGFNEMLVQIESRDAELREKNVQLQIASKAALDHERVLMRTLIDQLPDLVYVKDRQCRYLLANESLAKFTGVQSPAGLLGKSDEEFFPVALASEHRADDERVLTGVPIIEKEDAATHLSSGARTFLTSKLPLRDGHGTVTGLVGICHDITERTQAENRAKLQYAVTAVLAEGDPLPLTSQKILKTLGEHLHADVGEVWIVNRAAKILRCTEAWHGSADFRQFAETSRQTKFDRGSTPVARVWASGRAEWIVDITRDPTCRRRIAVEQLGLRLWIGFAIKLRNEVLGVVALFSSKAQTPDDKMLSLLEAMGTQLGQFMERQQLAEQFRQAQKMEAIGTLAGGIAHDFNNIIGAIRGYTELSKMELAEGSALNENLDAVLSGADRAAALVRQILAFSSQQEQERRLIQLRHVVGEALKLLRATIPASIEFDILLGPEVSPVLADATQIHQIVMNLCTNASHAMRDRPGRLGVKLEGYMVESELAENHPGLTPGPYVRLSISDTGHGMDEITQSRIFEPFFTTKAPGEGTGLGLSVVHGIVQSHGGVATVYSQPGEGTVFRIYFPASAGEVAINSGHSLEIVRGSGERVLYVDDEAPLAHMARMILEKLGYLVDIHTNALEALAAIRTNAKRFDLVITDLAMPGMTGIQLAQELAAIRADLPIVLVTGHIANLTADRVRAIGIREILFKPLSVHALSKAVHSGLTNNLN
jgi:PAS domain S-box-containing protein